MTEVEATVASYFEMLAMELSGRPYSKTEYRRRLLPLLNNRPEKSIEFKHCNISAILIELGFPFIAGYKPLLNYQGLLFDVVSERLAVNHDLQQVAERDVERAIVVPQVDDILRAWTDPPKSRERATRTAESRRPYLRLPVNYLEREARNRDLGTAGEKFVINFEQARLVKERREDLAGRVEHIARTRGDGAGFDVLSFEASGAERLIEVKTTKYGNEAPFYVSRNEVTVSEEQQERYFLYRVFEFRQTPGLFQLQGALSQVCQLDPSNYVARVA